MERLRAGLRRHWFVWASQIGAAFPLLLTAWDWQVGNLSINPIDDLTDRTGGTAINLLLLSLAVTPVQTVTGWHSLAPLRKLLGLWAFAYAVIHLLIFVGLDYGFDWRLIWLDGLPTKLYILAGLAALLILTPLAITSTRGWMKRLGKWWKRLHRLVYLAGILAVVHYIWVAKVAYGAPTVYAVILALLLAARIPWVRTRLAQLRTLWARPRPQLRTSDRPSKAIP
jgi:sulfoxide reductase heme-binding subunit YedZ